MLTRAGQSAAQKQASQRVLTPRWLKSARLGLQHGTALRCTAPRALQWRPRRRPVLVIARRRSRLATRITTIPRRIEFYFADTLLRRAVWGAISFSTGFYAANTVSLSFGALAINDVVAAAVTVAFCELCSSAFYGAERKTLKLLVVNLFKLGVITALVSDAFKLGG